MRAKAYSLPNSASCLRVNVHGESMTTSLTACAPRVAGSGIQRSSDFSPAGTSRTVAT